MKRTFKTVGWLFLMVASTRCGLTGAQEKPTAMKVVITSSGTANANPPGGKASDLSNVAVWLIPLDPADVSRQRRASPGSAAKLVQRHKTFEPHVLIVPVGTRVEFPNLDPFFHNIFSLYDGRRFDLGLYEAGTTRTVLFDRSGVSFLFCNIHGEMSAIVVAVDTPYFGLSDRAGNVFIPNVPDGRYQVNVWYERSLPDSLKELTRVVTISDSVRHLGTIRVLENPSFTPVHKNKYGLDYVPPPNSNYGQR